MTSNINSPAFYHGFENMFHYVQTLDKFKSSSEQGRLLSLLETF